MLRRNSYFYLLRIDHWFKNLVLFFGIFVGLLFTNLNWFSIENLSISIIAFLLASIVSSVNYIINQITDVKFDLQHPVKKERPLPSKMVTLKSSIFLLFLLLLATSIVATIFFPLNFNLTLAALFTAGIIYNVSPFRLKDIPYVDALTESINNPIRFLLGWFVVIPSTLPPNSILLLIWSAGAILMAGKRYDELLFYGETIAKYRLTFNFYSLATLKKLLYFYAAITLMLFVFISWQYKKKLLLGLPFDLIFTTWLVRQITSGRASARFVESFVLTKKFIFSSCALFSLHFFLLVA